MESIDPNVGIGAGEDGAGDKGTGAKGGDGGGGSGSFVTNRIRCGMAASSFVRLAILFIAVSRGYTATSVGGGEDGATGTPLMGRSDNFNVGNAPPDNVDNDTNDRPTLSPRPLVFGSG